MLFNDIVFGPIKSRRLGSSLGVNLLPSDGKICNFDCIYCECGLNSRELAAKIMPTFDEVKEALKTKLEESKINNTEIDVITFAGNGEPTIHVDFSKIIDITIELRDIYYPNAKISVLSNATMLHKPSVITALNRVDNNILKLDSVVHDTLFAINRPENSNFSVQKVIEQLKSFEGNVIIQTLFFTGRVGDKEIDNTTDIEVDNWLKAIDYIRPKQVMVYSLDRDTPLKSLYKASEEKMNEIANRVKSLAIECSVSV